MTLPHSALVPSGQPIWIDMAQRSALALWQMQQRGMRMQDVLSQASIRNAMAVSDVDGDGETDQLIPAGIVWMQGESDAAYSEEIAESYQANLKRLMDLIRAAFRSDDLPVAIGRISDSGAAEDRAVWKFGPTVRAAQAAYVAADGNAALVV